MKNKFRFLTVEGSDATQFFAHVAKKDMEAELSSKGSLHTITTELTFDEIKESMGEYSGSDIDKETVEEVTE
jgi:hypothetical protein